MRSTQIRDAIFAKVASLGLAASSSKIGILPVQMDNLPHARVFVLSESASPDGDGNAGAPSFIFDATIAIGVTRQGDDPDLIGGALDADADAIMSALFTDPDFMRMHPSGMFESCERMTRKIVAQRDGEALLAELQIELTFRFRADFEPLIPGEFHNYTATMLNLTAPNGSPVQVEYDLRHD